jgi:hypothetical protein
VDVEIELSLQRADRAGPVDRCTGLLVSAVAQPLQPAGLDVLVRKPTIDASATEPPLGADRSRGPVLQQLVYFRSHSTSNRRRIRHDLNYCRF